MATNLDDDRAATYASDSGRGSYSLLLLFYLTTIAAILVAAARLALDNELFTVRAFAVGSAIVALCGSIIGSVVGYLCARSVSGLMIGLAISFCLAPLASWIAMVQAKHFGSASAIVFVGCWLVIALAAVANRLQSQSYSVRRIDKQDRQDKSTLYGEPRS